MALTRKRKAEIDGMTYVELLKTQRWSAPNDRWVSGATGRYLEAAINRKRKEIGEAEHRKISKKVGL